MSIRYNCILAFICCAPWMTQAHQLNLYTIEAIVFENRLLAEYEGGLNPYFKQNDSVILNMNDCDVSIKEDSRCVKVSASDFTLTEVEKKLGQNGKKVLYHQAWQQYLPSESPFAMTVQDKSNQKMQGTLKVSLQRYLHLDTHLRFSSANGVDELKSSRRMKSNEMHYIDHPNLGVIVKISKSN